MSDTIEKTPQQLAKEKTEARVNELKALAGKTFVRKDANPNIPNQYFLVTKYVGVLTFGDGVKYHTLEIESRKPSDLKLVIAAIVFEKEFVPIEIAAEKTKSEEIQ